MKRFLPVCIIVFVLFSCSSVEKYNEKITTPHTVEALRSDIDHLYSQLKKNHPKLYQYISKSDLEFKFDSLKKSINTPLTSRAFYKKLAPVVAQVRQGHIALGSVSKQYKRKELKALNKKKFEFYDLEFDYLNDKLWVTNTRGYDSTLIGSELLKIEEDSTSNLVKTFKTRFASDGYNKTLYNSYVGKVFARLYFKEFGYKDSLKVVFKHADSIFSRTLKRVEKEKKKDTLKTDSLKVIKPKKRTPEERKDNRIANKKKRKYNRNHGFISKYDGYTRTFKFLDTSSTAVGYMKIKSFSNGNFKKFYEESFKKLDSAKTKNLIIDLRDNGGGRIAEISYLYGFLTNKKFKLIEESEVTNRLPYFNYLLANDMPVSLKVISTLFSPFIVTHNLIKTHKKNGKYYYKLRFAKEQNPHDLNYDEHIYVLINGNSFSASSLLSTHLKATNRAVFVGEETGGAYNGCVAGIYKVYKMPESQLKIRMGLMQIETPYKQEPDGYGILPDYEVLPVINFEDPTNDNQLNWVLQDIKKRKDN
ncbi:S41 family peptidase [Siansivirga zeaxanthinifaciens]|uniref:Peptidase S41 n=1 Tax=Siansivirga zeaxanthinifaciens CC-SAMT-1 TaxID=1454006 RepID=A0A0C5WME5_9FLAO|nr:S41 family peptidase [Siansivirga zeaxanthinifaciens]AJR04060.1 peptidase S41 [Siansivirga zeaxanthinifaciens CC-SAMT-1]